MVVTFGVRYPVLALVSRITLPPAVLAALKFIPACRPDRHRRTCRPHAGRRGLILALDNAYLVAAIAAALISWRSKNLLLTIVLGMAIFLALRWIF